MLYSYAKEFTSFLCFFTQIHDFNVSDLNECDFTPCANGGTCINSFGSYKCECPLGWQGPNCLNGKQPDFYGPLENTNII